MCSVDGCGNQAEVRGWCFKHYQRWRKHGDPTVSATDRGTPLEYRFLKRVQVTDDGCWLWIGVINSGGYGHFSISHSTAVMAHRWAYEHWVGPIPDGLTIDHLCRVRRCVNPAHLEAVTLRENLLRGDTPAARNAVKTHCKRGHEFTPENTIQVPRGRACRACRLEIYRRYNAKRRK